jgi:hypothetical protein
MFAVQVLMIHVCCVSVWKVGFLRRAGALWACWFARRGTWDETPERLQLRYCFSNRG